MMEAKEFFDLSDETLQQGLFAPDEPVWTTLDRLKDFLAGFFQDSWPLRGITGQVEKPLVIHSSLIR